ncbi:MAG: hypothetical protein V7637_4103 [Mycobacteriales bacterium]|jgi:hypothetical protein
MAAYPGTRTGWASARPRWRPELTGTLLVQCTPAEAVPVAAVADRPGAGLVLTRRITDRNGAAAAEAIRRLRDSGYRWPMLLDFGRYAGPVRTLASGPFSLDWIATQRRLRLPVLTDSGYVAGDDLLGLTSILDRARLLGDVIAVLPLHPSWLSQRGRRAYLLDRIEQAGVPVAIVVEHSKDPLGVQGVLAGLLELLTLPIPVLLLRGDTSALGALCFGAMSAAVGTTASLRHLFPMPRAPGRPRPAEVAAVVKQCLAFVGVDRIAAASQAEPDDPMWTCGCGTCKQRTLDWLATLAARTVRERAAFTHSVEVLLDLRDELCRPASPADRQASWLAHLANADCRYDQVDADSGALARPGFLGAWLALTAEPGLRTRARLR